MRRHQSNRNNRRLSVVELMEPRRLLSGATITAHVFNDLNGDGTLQSGEGVIAALSVYLDKNSNGIHDAGEPIGVTGSTGSLAFTGLAAGTYRVQSSFPLGYVGSAGNNGHVTVTVPANGSAVANIGFYKPAVISSLVFNDVNFDNMNDAGDLPLSGWQVYLDANNNSKLDVGERSITTGADGKYTFSNLAPGTYVVREVLKSGWQQTASLFSTVTATSGHKYVPGIFGNTLTASLCTVIGSIFDDFNGDGVRQTGEPTLTAWQPYIDLNNNGLYDNGEPHASSGANGAFSIQVLQPGTHTLRESLKSGWKQTTPAISFTAVKGKSTFVSAIGNQALVAGLTGTVFVDANINTTLDATDTRLAGVRVFLDLNKNGILDTNEPATTTNASGVYQFGGLAAGAYRLTHVPPTGYTAFYPVLNYVDVTLASSSQQITQNFGDVVPVPPSTFSGTIFHDLNNDKVREAGEPPVVGWRVYLDLNLDGAYQTNEPSVLTNAAGVYTFTNVPTGRYLIRPDDPAHWRTINYLGWYATSHGANTGNLDLAASQASKIGSRVYIDSNKNGLFDSGEPVLQGWTVYIDANNNQKLDTGELSFVTDNGGAFYWDGLAPGTYTIRVIQKPNFNLTTPSFYKITLGLGDFQVGFNFGETPG